RKLWWVMTAILVLLLAGTAFIFTVLPNVSPEEFEGFPGITKPDAYLFGASQAVGQTWFPLVFAAVLLAGETSTSVWASSLTREARRWMHLFAKLVVITVASTLAMAVGIAAWSGVVAFFAEGSGTPGLMEWAGVAGKTLVTQTTWVALGLGVVAVFRNMGPAIGAALGFSVIDGVLALWRPWTEVSLTIAGSRLIQDLTAQPAGPFGGGIDMGFGQALFVIAGWTMLGLLLGIVGLEVRDP
ncbi:MAG: hypothetical protein R3246_03995, partial [Acidimicrobiia bacterium]|nr:hypothetical protein [Acidimicrobiia bacterium]